MTDEVHKSPVLLGVAARKIPSGWQVVLNWQHPQRKRSVTQAFQVRTRDVLETPELLWTEILIAAAGCGIALPESPEREIGGAVRNKVGDVCWGRAP